MFRNLFKKKRKNLSCPNCNHDKWAQSSTGGVSVNITCENCQKTYTYNPVIGIHS